MTHPEPGQWPHVMVDLETLSLAPDARILSIGATVFDPDSTVPWDDRPKFYTVLRIADADQVGTHLSAETVAWWMYQGPEARDVFAQAMLESAPYCCETLVALRNWICAVAAPEFSLWSNGSVDVVWLTRAFQRHFLSLPWKFWQENDYRTLLNRCPRDMPKHRPAVKHHALDDATAQAKNAEAILRQTAAAFAHVQVMP